MIILKNHIFIDKRDSELISATRRVIDDFDLSCGFHWTGDVGTQVIWFSIYTFRSHIEQDFPLPMDEIRREATRHLDSRLITQREARRRGFYKYSARNMRELSATVKEYVNLFPNNHYSIVINIDMIATPNAYWSGLVSGAEYTAYLSGKDEALTCIAKSLS